MAGDDALFGNELFAAQAEERAAEQLDVAAPLAVRMRQRAWTRWWVRST